MFNTENEYVEYLEEKIAPYTLNKKGEASARNQYKQFPSEVLVEAIEISLSQYLRYDEKGEMTKESVENCISKIGGIAHNKMLSPIDAAIKHILAIGNKTFNYWNDNAAREILSKYINALKKVNYNDLSIESDLEKEVIPLLKNSANWTSWKSSMTGWTKDVLSWSNEETIEQNESILPKVLYQDTRGPVERLAAQINASYEHNLYDCCAVMLRRLMEVLLVLAFQNLDKENLIIDKKRQHHISLDGMIKAANSCKELALSSNTKKDMSIVKDLGNYSAHKIWYNCTKKDIEPIIIKYRAIIEELLYKAGIRE